jgi:pimeloyl-[acyl-carrier protein] methyl ester esterase
LHIEVTGSGEPLLLIHGWGMHGGVWTEVAQRLAADFQVLSVDLPGYGFSVGRDSSRHQHSVGMDPDPQLHAVVAELSSRFTGPLSICGWSLGGIIAQHWAAYEPEKVKRLILVASTPCFAEREDWQFGMPQETLAQFGAELEKNPAATLRRFIALQLRGSENERELLGQLRERLFSRGEPDTGALRGGLEILRDADLRATLPEISQPTLLIAGERDKLTPPEASYFLAQAMQNARVVEVAGAAHAPFLSHSEQFVETVKGFLNAKDN